MTTSFNYVIHPPVALGAELARSTAGLRGPRQPITTKMKKTFHMAP